MRRLSAFSHQLLAGIPGCLLFFAAGEAPAADGHQLMARDSQAPRPRGRWNAVSDPEGPRWVRAGGAPAVVETGSAAATEELGRDLAGRLPGGSLLLLYGDLGAGKTAFIRGLAAGLGVDPEEVSSPTFTIVQEYRGGRVRLQHVDLYRIHTGPEVEELGLDEFLARGDIVAIEWADRLPEEPAGALSVRLVDLGDDRRRITITEVR